MNLDLTTDRLHLKPFSEDDAELWVSLRTSHEVMKHIKAPLTHEAAQAEIPGMCIRGGGGALGFWRVCLRESEEPIGTCILLPLPEHKRDAGWNALSPDELGQHDIELGYHLLPSAWGKGYATEAAVALLKFAFEETPLERVLAVTNSDNLGSQKVLLKAGLQDTGIRRAYGQDVSAFEITREEWLERQAA